MKEIAVGDGDEVVVATSGVGDRMEGDGKLPASPPPFAGSSRSAAPSSFQISLTVPIDYHGV